MGTARANCLCGTIAPDNAGIPVFRYKFYLCGLHRAGIVWDDQKCWSPVFVAETTLTETETVPLDDGFMLFKIGLLALLAAIEDRQNAGPNISCDACPRASNRITGKRFKCVTCDNYDLCEAHYNSGAHAEHSTYLRFETLKSEPEAVRRVARAAVVAAVDDGDDGLDLKYQGDGDDDVDFKKPENAGPVCQCQVAKKGVMPEDRHLLKLGTKAVFYICFEHFLLFESNGKSRNISRCYDLRAEVVIEGAKLRDGTVDLEVKGCRANCRCASVSQVRGFTVGGFQFYACNKHRALVCWDSTYAYAPCIYEGELVLEQVRVAKADGQRAIERAHASHGRGKEDEDPDRQAAPARGGPTVEDLMLLQLLAALNKP